MRGVCINWVCVKGADSRLEVYGGCTCWWVHLLVGGRAAGGGGEAGEGACVLAGCALTGMGGLGLAMWAVVGSAGLGGGAGASPAAGGSARGACRRCVPKAEAACVL